MDILAGLNQTYSIDLKLGLFHISMHDELNVTIYVALCERFVVTRNVVLCT